MTDLARCQIDDGRSDLQRLTSAELLVIGDVWKRHRREISARFGGTSMLPTIEPHAELLIRCADEVNPNDVIAFVHADQLVVHRAVILGHDRSWIATRGDANALPDPFLVDRSSVIGTVVKIRRDGQLADLPAPPRTIGRWLALTPYRLAALFGPVTLRRMIGLTRRLRSIGQVGGTPGEST